MREKMTDTHYGSENETKKNGLAWMGIEPTAFGLALQLSTKAIREYLTASSHPELWIAVAGESGNVNVVGSAMITNLNVVV